MKKISSFMLVFSLVQALNGQVLPYAVSLIPPELKVNARSVVRLENIRFELRSVSKASLKIHSVVTYLAGGETMKTAFQEYTDRFRALGEVSIKIYDAEGKPVSRYEKKDLSSESNWMELVPDGKYHSLQVPVNQYPITIECDYSVSYHGVYNYPYYYFQEEKQSVENSEYNLVLPKEMELRYRPMNTELQPVIDESDRSNRSYQWKVSRLPAKSLEPGAGPVQNVFPWVMIAPTRFELDGYPGDMKNWKDFGLWYNSLVKNDNQLSEAFRAEIKAVVANGRDDHEKVKLIYRYLQRNFRYVSIQLGIGGFKPFSADFVHKKKYGDCKALSNYLQACLSVVNIRSYSAWIRAGSDEHVKIEASFPYDPFNHQVVCVPMEKDSLWLECTSPVDDAGFMGSFTADREALLLTENGGVLVRTPKPTPLQNQLNVLSRIMLQEDGSGTATVRMTSNGDHKSSFLYRLSEERKDEQKTYFVETLDFIAPDEFSMAVDKTDPMALTQVNMSAEKWYDFKTGGKLFLHPRIRKIWNDPLPRSENRTQDYYFNLPFLLTDTTIYRLPEGFTPETLPGARGMKNEYGSYSTNVRFNPDNREIISTATLILKEYHIPASKYAGVKKFFDEVQAEYNEKIIIRRL
ncbi:MAG: DUF3857 domain-containing protein [Chitinophagaceae bacterium]|nr:DUF3857 domain-containing protein [Chitinophagaceae bacterium]